VQHTFPLLCRIFLYSCPTGNNFFPVCVFWNPLKSLPGRTCLGPIGVVCFSGNWSLYELDSYSGLLISKTFLPRAGNSCTAIFCWGYMFSTQKMHWRVHSLADTPPRFSTIWQFFSEMTNDWDTSLPYLCPSWIYCTGQQCTVFYFQVSFSVFPSCVHHCCVMDHIYHLHKSSVHLHLDHHITLP